GSSFVSALAVHGTMDGASHARPARRAARLGRVHVSPALDSRRADRAVNWRGVLSDLFATAMDQFLYPARLAAVRDRDHPWRGGGEQLELVSCDRRARIHPANETDIRRSPPNAGAPGRFLGLQVH